MIILSPRSKKLSVLIHNSSSHPNVEWCRVAVHFQEIIDKGGEEFEIVANSQFSVSRTAHKDNSSYYSVNGKRAQYKEVAKILREKGIDLDHNRFLILQVMEFYFVNVKLSFDLYFREKLNLSP